MLIQKKTTGLNIAAGVVLIFFAFQMILSKVALYAGVGIALNRNFLWSIQRFFHGIPFFRTVPSNVLFSMVFRSLALIFLAVCAFRGKRDVLPFVGTALLTICNFITLYPRLLAPPIHMLGELFNFLAAGLLAAIALMVMLKKGTGLIKKLWFLPAIPALISVLMGIGINLSVSNIPPMIVLFRHGGFMSILSVSVYLLFGLWLTRESVQTQMAADAIAAQKNAQLIYYYDLYVKGAITAEEYEMKRRQIEGF